MATVKRRRVPRSASSKAGMSPEEDGASVDVLQGLGDP